LKTPKVGVDYRTAKSNQENIYACEIQDLSRCFNSSIWAIKNLTLRVKKGEQLAIIGPSGAGKTTLFRILNCTIPPTSGRVLIEGIEVQKLTNASLCRLRRRIGTIYQQNNLVGRLKVIHNVLAGRLGEWSTLKSLFSLIKPFEVEKALEVLEQVGIADKLYARTDELSGGQQQRVAIARVLIQNPAIILADEPVSSVDPSLAENIIKLLLEIAKTQNRTLIVSLHSVHLALSYFPRIVGLRKGRILFDLPASQVTPEHLSGLFSDNSGSKHKQKIGEGVNQIGDSKGPCTCHYVPKT
jgi:phosphonate transport system ATP-binding protein